MDSEFMPRKRRPKKSFRRGKSRARAAARNMPRTKNGKFKKRRGSTRRRAPKRRIRGKFHRRSHRIAGRRPAGFTRVYVYYHPDETLHDDAIRKVVGRHSDGSGYMFGTGERDLEWGYKDKRTAGAAARRLKAKFGGKVRVSVKAARE